MSYTEGDSRALRVLARALGAAGRVTRLRAVSMLAHVACDNRVSWLETACTDSDASVAATARIVLSWVAEATTPQWPEREDPRFDPVVCTRAEQAVRSPREGPSRWQWEYVVEVWREDGLLVGVYFAATCQEDDEHARRIALGQAILENAGGRGDSFDAGTAASFIVGKRRLRGPSDEPGKPGRGAGRRGVA